MEKEGLHNVLFKGILGTIDHYLLINGVLKQYREVISHDEFVACLKKNREKIKMSVKESLDDSEENSFSLDKIEQEIKEIQNGNFSLQKKLEEKKQEIKGFYNEPEIKERTKTKKINKSAKNKKV